MTHHVGNSIVHAWLSAGAKQMIRRRVFASLNEISINQLWYILRFWMFPMFRWFPSLPCFNVIKWKATVHQCTNAPMHQCTNAPFSANLCQSANRMKRKIVQFCPRLAFFILQMQTAGMKLEKETSMHQRTKNANLEQIFGKILVPYYLYEFFRKVIDFFWLK